MEVKRNINQFAKKLTIEFDHKGLVDELYRLFGEDLIMLNEYKDQRCCGGYIDLQEKLCFALLTTESRMCESVALSFWQQEFKRWFDYKDVVKIYPDNKGVETGEFQDAVNEKIANMRLKL